MIKLSKKRVYMDYASLTPVDRRVMKEMTRHSSPNFANPSSLYTEGVAAKKILSASRESVAGYIHAHSDEIIFTSGGTESNILAIQGTITAALENNVVTEPHVIISAIEHSSIIEYAHILEKQGYEVTRIPVSSDGIIDLDILKKSIKENTVLISIMTVNNEIGSIQPIREIAKIIRQFKKMRKDISSAEKLHYPLFHTDAAQAAVFMDLNMENFGVDLLTLDGSKVYGPRGIGCLYIKRGTPIRPIIYGGGQEAGMRSGTENIPSIAGLAKAFEIAKVEISKDNTQKRFDQLRIRMINGLRKIRADISVNGAVDKSDVGVSIIQAPHILNVSIPGIDNEFVLFQLDAAGVSCSTKSSCLRDSDESYVLRSIGAPSQSSLRFSFGRDTSSQDIDHVLKILQKILR